MVFLIDEVKTSVDVLQQSISCDRVHGLYADAVGGLCDTGILGLGWSFVATVVMSAFMMVMITLRASWKVSYSKEDDLKEEEIDNNPRIY